MNWAGAKAILEIGGKIRLPHWKEESFWELSKDGFGRIICHTGFPAKVHINQLTETTWELWRKEEDLRQKAIKLVKDFESSYEIRGILKIPEAEVCWEKREVEVRNNLATARVLRELFNIANDELLEDEDV